MPANDMQKGRRGFTLVEIMIVVLIIGILLAIAIPNFLKARQTSQAKACQGNLRQIDTARQQWAIEFKQGAQAEPALTDLVPTYVKNTPTCPSGGTYSINSIEFPPTCTFSSTDSNHQLLP